VIYAVRKKVGALRLRPASSGVRVLDVLVNEMIATPVSDIVSMSSSVGGGVAQGYTTG
jgi:hypothetical protein